MPCVFVGTDLSALSVKAPPLDWKVDSATNRLAWNS